MGAVYTFEQVGVTELADMRIALHCFTAIGILPGCIAHFLHAYILYYYLVRVHCYFSNRSKSLSLSLLLHRALYFTFILFSPLFSLSSCRMGPGLARWSNN
ncbi:hypothetical protein TWF594_011857 [Orbilia oligospora]|nr:hypothetical protein TWF706_012018 [Orbilia oligospora]KAF3123270.1 hypothetical protein TWF594_011857 [Orbilia oligospora]